jgi:glycosyltransferase involved in cell wall biosynthesis
MQANPSQSFSINGRFATQGVTGVQRYAREIVRSIDRILADSPRLEINGRIVIPPGGSFEYRPSSLSVHPTNLGSGIAWEQFILPIYRRGPLLNLCNQGPLGLTDQIVCIHDLNTIVVPQSYSRSFRALYRVTQPVLANRAAKLVTVSQYSAGMLDGLGYRHESRIQVIPNGHEHVTRWNADASSLALSQRRRPYVFALGSQAKHKNVETLYSIAPALDSLGIDLLIAGGAAAIFSDVSPADRQPNIVHLGFVSDNDLAALFRHALCFAFPSLTEGFGLPVLESMALGCPVIASDIPALREVASDSALYADPELPAAWLDAISALKRQSELCAALRNKGLARAKLFSWTTGAEAYLDIIGGMLS